MAAHTATAPAVPSATADQAGPRPTSSCTGHWRATSAPPRRHRSSAATRRLRHTGPAARVRRPTEPPPPRREHARRDEPTPHATPHFTDAPQPRPTTAPTSAPTRTDTSPTRRATAAHDAPRVEPPAASTPASSLLRDWSPGACRRTRSAGVNSPRGVPPHPLPPMRNAAPQAEGTATPREPPPRVPQRYSQTMPQRTYP